MRKIFCYILGLILLVCIAACTNFKMPTDYESANWSCDEPIIKLHHNGVSLAECEAVGDIIEFHWIQDTFMVTKENIEVISEDEILLSGSYQFDGDDIILTIEEDYLFDYKYSEIRMVYQN